MGVLQAFVNGKNMQKKGTNRNYLIGLFIFGVEHSVMGEFSFTEEETYSFKPFSFFPLNRFNVLFVLWDFVSGTLSDLKSIKLAS